MKGLIKNIDKKSIYLIIVSFLVFGVMVSFSLSSFLVTLYGQNSNRINTCALSVNMVESNPIALLSAYPISDQEASGYEPYNVTLTNNSGCGTVYYKLVVSSLCDTCELENGICTSGGNTCNCNDNYQIDPELIKYEVKNTTTGAVTTGNNPYEINIADTFTSFTASITYEIKMWISSTATEEDLYVYEDGEVLMNGANYVTKNFCSKVHADVSNETIKYTLKDSILRDNIAYPDNVKSSYVTAATGIDFSTVSSPTNGQGLYKTSTGTEGAKLTYYFRGGSYCSNASLTTSTACTAITGAKWSANHCTLPATTKIACEATTGNVWYELNNWVSFGGYYWQIIRINEDGSIRMLYAGTSITNKDTDDRVASSSFNGTKIINGTSYSVEHDITSTGYMFSSPVGKTYTNNTYTTTESEAIGENSNQIESNIKVTLEDWYEKYINGITTGTCSSSGYTTRKTCLDAGYSWTPGTITNTNYSDYVADTGFCNDRSKNSGDGFGNSGWFKTYYGTNTYTGVIRRNSPQYICNQRNDLFTVKNVNGNRMSTYPVGLITSDEAIYSGGYFMLDNYSYYLYSVTSFWGMSPFYLGSTYSNVWGVRSTGGLSNYYANDNRNVRPVISLRSDVIITSGNGSADSPYVVG